MTPEKVRSVVEKYKHLSIIQSITRRIYSPSPKGLLNQSEQLMHIASILDTLQSAPAEENIPIIALAGAAMNYRIWFKKSECIGEKCSTTTHNAWKHEQMKHVHAMLPDIENYYRNHQLDKVKRHLGFIEGVMWSLGEMSISALFSKNLSPSMDKIFF